MANNLVDLQPKVTPAGVIKVIKDQIEEDWNIFVAFSPGLDYEEAFKNFSTDHVATDSFSSPFVNESGHKLLDSLFAWNRSQLRLIDGVGHAGIRDRLCEGTVDATVMGEFDIEFTAFFSDMQTAEAFEIGFMANQILRCYTGFVVERSDSTVANPISENFNMTWSDIESIDWNLAANNYISMSFKTTITGTFRTQLSPDNLSIPTELLTIHFNSIYE